MPAMVRDSGVRAWVQDGAGTGRLSRGESAVYLAAALSCDQRAAAGVVYEVFRQTGGDAAFKAEPLDGRQADAALLQRAPCGDTAFFELRYLPEMQALLKAVAQREAGLAAADDDDAVVAASAVGIGHGGLLSFSLDVDGVSRRRRR